MKSLSYFDICKINNVMPNKKREESFNYKKIKLKNFIKEENIQGFDKIFRIINLYHNGMRKGDEIPEIQHFYNIMSDVIDLKEQIKKSGLSLFNISVLVLTHDLYEDYNEKDIIWKNNEKRLSGKIPVSIDMLNYITNNKILTKKILSLSKINEFGIKKKTKHYFREIGKDPELILVKILDRKDSLKTMVNVFSEEKKEKYIQDYNKYIKVLPEKIVNSEDKIIDLFKDVIMKAELTIMPERIIKERKNSEFNKRIYKF